MMRRILGVVMLLILAAVFVGCGGDDTGGTGSTGSTGSTGGAPADVTLRIHYLDGYGFAAPECWFYVSGGAGQALSALSNTAQGYLFVTNIKTAGNYAFSFRDAAPLKWESVIVGNQAQFERGLTVAAGASGIVSQYAVSWNKRLQSSPWDNLEAVAHNLTNAFGGSYVMPGASKVGGDFLFSVFAPKSIRARLAGEMTSWVTAAIDMKFDHRSGYWWTKQTAGGGYSHGKQYKFILDAGSWLSDPYGKAFETSGDANSLIVDASYAWGDGSWSRPDRTELVVYEMQVKDFLRSDSDVSLPGFLGVKQKVQYLTNLGVNAVELMPIQEWPGGWYSWGYNNSGYFAPENSYASTTPKQSDGSVVDEFKELVDALHQNGIAVILDVVYNHTANDNNYLWTIDNDYFFDPAGTDWGNKVEMRNPMTQKFVLDNLKYLMDEFHVDGFRFDSTENMDIASLLTVVEQLRANGYADRYYIFEEFSGQNANIRTYNNAQGSAVVSSWGTGFKYTIWGAVNTGWDGNLGKVTYYSKDDGWKWPVEVVNYFSSHDEGTLQGRQGADKVKVRVAAAHLLTAMGIPMIWMGDEVMRLHYGNHPPSGSGIDESNNVMDWDTLRAAHQDLIDYYAGLIKLRRAHPNLRLNVIDPGGTAAAFEWATAAWGDYLGYLYKQSGDNGFVVLVNYKNTAFDGITVKFPATGTWHLMCNGTNAVSDKASALGSITVSGATHAIDLPARTALVYMSDNVLP